MENKNLEVGLIRGFKGVWIDKEIWFDKKLTWMEKLLLTEINSLDGENGCFASNYYLAEFFQLSAGRVSQIIKALIDKKYVSVEYKKKGKQIIKRVLRILNTGIKDSKGGIKDSKEGYLEKAKGINTKNNNTINNTKTLICKPVIDYLNNLTKKKFNPRNDSAVKDLAARINETGIDDCKKVLEYLAKKWLKDDKMKSYVNYSTPFRKSNFYRYLDSADNVKNVQENDDFAEALGL